MEIVSEPDLRCAPLFVYFRPDNPPTFPVLQKMLPLMSVPFSPFFEL